jgi:hypothetical protein
MPLRPQMQVEHLRLKRVSAQGHTRKLHYRRTGEDAEWTTIQSPGEWAPHGRDEVVMARECERRGSADDDRIRNLRGRRRVFDRRRPVRRACPTSRAAPTHARTVQQTGNNQQTLSPASCPRQASCFAVRPRGDPGWPECSTVVNFSRRE